MNIQPGYESLAGVLQRALDQAQTGKGAERHANELPFIKQPMQTIAGQVGVAFLTGQAIKKTQESQCLPEGRDVAELLGAINYLAGAILFTELSRPPVAANDNSPSLARLAEDLEHVSYSPIAPIVQMKRLGELPRAALEMLKIHCEAELLRKQADEMQGRDHG